MIQYFAYSGIFYFYDDIPRDDQFVSDTLTQNTCNARRAPIKESTNPEDLKDTSANAPNRLRNEVDKSHMPVESPAPLSFKTGMAAEVGMVIRLL